MFGYLDCTSGVSGDKMLGAIIDAGVPVELLRDRLAGLRLPGWDLSATEVRRGGLHATLATVTVADGPPHRAWRDVERLLLDADIPEPARQGALRAFELLANAEADAHGVPVDEVHFHEVGAADSIVDIAGSAIGLDELGIDELWASDVCVGSGSVRTMHGELPVPAPATAALLLGVPTFSGGEQVEMTTPTGAALLRAFVTSHAPAPLAIGTAIGYGAGSRETSVPNVLRLTVSERAPLEGTDEQVVLLDSVIDHMAPEHLAIALELVLSAGALDVWQTPVVMKKGRLASAVTVMARHEDARRLSVELMRQTGTLGVRHTATWRAVAERREHVNGSGADEMRVKTGGLPDAEISRPEADDIARLARRTGEAVRELVDRFSRPADGAAEAAPPKD